jgi:hypothetical protein
VSLSVKSWLVSHLAIVAVALAREQFENPEEGERPPLEAVTRRSLKAQQAKKI